MQIKSGAVFIVILSASKVPKTRIPTEWVTIFRNKENEIGKVVFVDFYKLCSGSTLAWFVRRRKNSTKITFISTLQPFTPFLGNLSEEPERKNFHSSQR